MSGDPHFSFQKLSPLLIPLIFRNIRKNLTVRSYQFFSFLTPKGAHLRLSWVGKTNHFSSRMLFLPNGMTPVPSIYLIGLLSQYKPKMLGRQVYFFVIFNIWSNLSQMESTIKTSINTVVFGTGYLENEHGDPPIFLHLWPENLWSLPNHCKNYLKIWLREDFRTSLIFEDEPEIEILLCIIINLNQGCHSSEAEKFPDFSLTSGQFSLPLNLIARWVMKNTENHWSKLLFLQRQSNWLFFLLFWQKI